MITLDDWLKHCSFLGYIVRKLDWAKHIALLEGTKLRPQLSLLHPAASPTTSRSPSDSGKSVAKWGRFQSASPLRCSTCEHRRAVTPATSATASLLTLGARPTPRSRSCARCSR